jgi:hypothetical protein
MALKRYRYKPSRSTGLANIAIAGTVLVLGIVAKERGELEGGDSPWFYVWAGLFVAMLIGFTWTTFSKTWRGSTVLLPRGRKDRVARSALARSLGTFEPEDEDRR